MILIFFLSMNSASGQSRNLDFFISAATTNSPLLKDLQNQVKINQLDSLLVLASQKPQISFAGNNNYAPVINGWGYDEAFTNGANVSAMLTINKSLLNGFNNRIQFSNLKVLSDIIRNNMLITEQDIKKSVVSQYIIAYGDYLQVNFTKELQEMLLRQDTVLKELTEKNVYKQVDYLSFYVTLQQNEFKLKQLSIQYRNDYFILNYLCGIKDSIQPLLEEPGLTINTSLNPYQSVFIKKYDLDSASLVINRKLLAVSYRPKLNVFADAGYNSSLAYKPYKNVGGSIGLNLTVPLYDGRQKKIQFEKIRLQEMTRLANKQYYTAQYNQQMLQLKNQLKETTDLINDINIQLKYIKTLIAANEKLLQSGDVRIYDYIQSLNNYVNARNMINENTITRLQILNQLNYWNR